MMRTALSRFGTSITTAAMALLLCSCKENPVDSGIPETNLFPVATGRIWVSTAYQLDTTNSQKILSTVHREVSFAHSTLSFNGKSAYLLIDSIYTPAGTLAQTETSYVAIENGDLFQWESDYSMWFSFFKKSEGLEKEYVIAQFQEMFQGMPVNVTIKGMIHPKEPVEAPIGTVQAYRLEMNVLAVVGGQSIKVFENFTYFADGYGPVRFLTPVQIDQTTGLKAPGEESLLVSKNF